ncbi:unnamed protein product [Urochloa decumbens]|uniref:Uncharacterized protein n=1 Tax=Urochloa decumbens TaxID=240449 RepID=A0ABC8WI40_9POAL
MTTAARPTWAPAKGGNEQGGTRIFGPSQKYSSRDLAAHTSLKPRKEGQQTQEELQKRNLKEELEERERKHYSSKDKSYAEERDRRKSSSQLLLEGSKRDAEDKIVPREIDADDSDVEPKSDDESDESDDDDDDDTEALMAELERIKKERAEEKLRKERQQAEEEAKMKEAELMRGNPLININNPGSFSVKRRWDDDVVFKNQARGETKTPKRFINDTIRSDFHRKFLQRYMK